MSNSLVVLFFTFVGAAILALLIHQLILGLKAFLIPKFNSRTPLSLIYGPWAIITGCTDGIGKAYAEELARRGMNIILISRNFVKLKDFSIYLESSFKIKTKIVVADFTKGQPIYAHIEREIKDIPIGILVNNVGKQYTYPMYVAEIPEMELWDIININVGATTFMTRLVLPQMIERKKGAIINISSGSELQPMPLMTVYAATKAFIRSFSDALRIEYQGEGLTVQHVSPMFVNTKMNSFSHRLQKNSLFVPDAQTYVKSAICTLGQVTNTTGYWAHGLQHTAIVFVPIWVRAYIAGFLNKIFRNDYLKNLSKDCR